MRAWIPMVIFVLSCGGAGRAVEPGAATGEAAAWSRLREHLDRFDRARFARDPAERAALLAALGVKDAGPDAAARARTTDAVLDALLVETDAILARDRLHAGAGAARVLLGGDREPPKDRAGLLARATALKAIARGGGDLAPNATLRLAAMCDAAFRDAVVAPPRERPQRLATCLYPLWDADPAPYFDADPARRPPPPSWEELDRRQAELLAGLGRSGGRLAGLAAPLRAAEEKRIAEAREAGTLPRALDPRAMGVPMVRDPAVALPYDWEPLIFVHDPSPAELGKFEEQLGGMLESDGRGRVALALRADAAAKGFLDVAALARRLGAREVALVVGFEQQVRAPAGDYWYGRSRDGRVARLGLLPLAAEGAQLGARSTLGLTLVVEPTRWQLVAASGAMPGIVVGADVLPSRTELREQLAAVLDAFPDEAGLRVVVDPRVTVGSLAAALHGAAREANGPVLVGALALADKAPARPAGAGELPARVERRGAARVKIEPEALGATTAARVRRCVQDAVEARALPGGAVLVEMGAKGVAVTGGEPGIARCVAGAVEKAMRDGGITRARVEYESTKP